MKTTRAKSSTASAKTKPSKASVARAAEKPAPSAIEREAIQLAATSVAKRNRRLIINVETTSDGKIGAVGPKHNDVNGFISRLENAFGTRGQAFAISELNQIFQFLRKSDGGIDETTANAMLAIIDGLQPANEIEAMLASQMAVTHRLAMELLQRAKNATHVPQLECNGQLGIKLLRTFTMQLDALAKMRRGGEQTVRVEHVHVYPGGQAIVGNVGSQGPPRGQGQFQNKNQPHAPQEENQDGPTQPRSLVYAPGQTLPGCHPSGLPMPIASGSGKEPL